MYTKINFIDRAVANAKRFFMNWDGGNDKNLLPPFSDWTLHANAVVDSANPYKITLTSTTGGQSTSIDIPVIPSTTYKLQATLTASAGSAYLNYYSVNASGVQTYKGELNTTTVSSATITTNADTAILRLNFSGTVAGTYTITNPQLELGSTATAFAPKKLYTITQSPGTVTQAGTPLNAANLNKMEQGIYDAHVTADGALQRTGGTMTGSLGLPSAGGVTSFSIGNGDSATYTTYNTKLHLHNGLALATYDDTIQGYYDSRQGKWDVKNGYYIDGIKLPTMRVHSSGTYVEWWNGSAWVGVGGIKSVQRGVSSSGFTGGGTNPAIITISAVNMAKSFVNYNVAAAGGSSYIQTIAYLQSSTQLAIQGINSGMNGVAWEVVESY